jgi:glutamate synthase (NADPH/NADH) small chain/NADH-quinone oxidoreductase subunit I
MALGEKSFFAPFSILANLFRKPATIQYPKEDLNVHGKPGRA